MCPSCLFIKGIFELGLQSRWKPILDCKGFLEKSQIIKGGGKLFLESSSVLG